MPETENRSLEEIELHFSDNSKKFSDRKILKQDKVNYNDHEELGNRKEPINKKNDAQGCDNKAFVN